MSSAAFDSELPARRGLPVEGLIGQAVAGIAAHLVLRFGLSRPAIQNWPLLAVPGARRGAARCDWAGRPSAAEFGSDLLAGISIVTSVLLGEDLAGAFVVLMLSGGETLEEFAAGRASSVLAALARRMPAVAHRRRAEAGQN